MARSERTGYVVLRMALPFTKHDQYNVHKTLGVLVLAHTMYRVCLTLRHGAGPRRYDGGRRDARRTARVDVRAVLCARWGARRSWWMTSSAETSSAAAAPAAAVGALIPRRQRSGTRRRT